MWLEKDTIPSATRNYFAFVRSDLAKAEEAAPLKGGK